MTLLSRYSCLLKEYYIEIQVIRRMRWLQGCLFPGLPMITIRLRVFFTHCKFNYGKKVGQAGLEPATDGL
ncbi:MAG: hypothetical protein S4CHLAM45_03430 [Chlamydiales bacterium]|nr:hypothetical protein [Chlamydiales bacterium]MCH9619198.1 hypothetical protein [Chlamydiales bacterium]MCH9622460.1 hypothetical protein [Chlamydiales bacterium]